MEDWAARISEIMSARGITAAEIARACKIQPGSVSGWFGGGKATKMISGDNLVAAARRLGTTAEFIMTGNNNLPVQSHDERLDSDKLAIVLEVVEGAIADSRKRVPREIKARMIKRVYEGQHQLSADTAPAVQQALAAVLESFAED